MNLAEALALRAKLLEQCRATDTAAAELRERGETLDVMTRIGFRALDELRLVERQIAKLKEANRAGK
jgi:hypothetical protein